MSYPSRSLMEKPRRSLWRGLFPIATAALLWPAGAGAVTALRTVQTVTQPDGSTLEVCRLGDESFHCLVTPEGFLTVETPCGFDFARLSADGRIVTTGQRAVSGPTLGQIDTSALTFVGDGGMALRQSVLSSAQRRAPMRGPGRNMSSFPATGDANVLVILVEYQDVKFNLPDPFAYVDGMLNREGFSDYGGTGCAKEYFKDNSNDLFRPHFDVFGPVTLPQPMAYYGGNNDRGSDNAAHEMVIDAARLLDDQIDFTRYDMDDDGYVDNIFIIYAGQGEATYGKADTVWPHSSDLIGYFTFEVLDKKILNHYACCNEWLDNRPDGVGTFIHEFSHVIGLPDLYCTSGEYLTCTPGSWSVLDYGPYNNGGHTPPNYSAYERYAMGWLDPVALGEARNLALDPLADGGEISIIPVEGTANEYFLLENRQQTGWDTYLPGHGMLVWHVDYDPSYFESNKVNNASKHQRVDLIEAGGKADASRWDVMATYAWPGPAGATDLGFTTTPQLADWQGRDTGVALGDIRETPDGRILATVNGGLEVLAVPAQLAGSDNGDSSMTLTWQAVSGAEAYELEVRGTFDGEAGQSACNMGAGAKLELPEGWTSSTTKVYSTSGNYGAASPSLKMENDGDWLESPVMPADITELSFWIKGQQTVGSTLTVMGLVEGQWKEIGSLEPENNKAQTVTMPVTETGVRAVRFVYGLAKGRVALDDVAITYGSADFMLEGYAPVRIEGTRATVLCTRTADRFLCRVRAVGGDWPSQWSAPVSVSVRTDGVAAIPGKTSLRISGREIMADSMLDVYTPDGRRVASGFGRVQVPSAGLYIVVTGNSRAKVLIK